MEPAAVWGEYVGALQRLSSGEVWFGEGSERPEGHGCVVIALESGRKRRGSSPASSRRKEVRAQ